MAVSNVSINKFFRPVCRRLSVIALVFWLPAYGFAETKSRVIPQLEVQQEEPSKYRHYNRLLRTQLSNLWAYVEGAVLTRSVWDAITQPLRHTHPLDTGIPGVTGTATPITAFSDTATDKLVSILTQINEELRTSPKGKHFLITSGTFSNLHNFMNGTDVQGMSKEKMTVLDSLIKGIKEKANLDMKQIIANSTGATSSQKKGAITISPFAQQGLTERQAAADSIHSDDGMLPDGHTIARRMERARVYTNWKDQLFSQTLAGAMAGAGIEAVITVTYKSVYEQRPPWLWDDSDTAEVATAAAGGALFGALGTAANWALQYRLKDSMLGHLWITNTIVTGSLHLLKESAKIATLRDDALSLGQLAESMPATLVISLGAYIGEQATRIPLAGAITGAVTARLAVGVAHNYLHHYLNATSAPPVHANASIPNHISVGVVQPVAEPL